MSRFEAVLQEAQKALKEAEMVQVPNKFIVKERYGGKWINTYFDNEKQAKRLCMKILAKGGRAVWMRNAR